MNVLIADDDKMVYQCLLQLIPWEKYDASVIGYCDNGEAAWNAIQKSAPDLLISDIKMPVMDGAVLCEKLRSENRELPIIFLSAYEDFSAAQAAIRYGVTEYILKPLHRETIDRLEAAIGRVRSRMQTHGYFARLISETEYEQEITQKLAENDEVYFSNLFDAFLHEDGWEPSQLKTTCMALAQILLRYLSNQVGLAPGGQAILERRQQLSAQDTPMQVVSKVSKMYMDFVHFQSELKNDSHSVLAENMRVYIEANYHRPDFSVVDIATQFSYSSDYTAKMFNQKYGMSIASYTAHLRLQKSQELLKSTNASISNIARIVGFDNANYFAKVFRKQFCISPSEYRERYYSAMQSETTLPKTENDRTVLCKK